MATDEAITNLLKTADDTAAAVISDTQGRSDYSKTESLSAAVSTLTAFRQDLKNAMAEDTLADATTEALVDKIASTVNPLYTSMIGSNIAISQMGQLNTNRTITPEQALGLNGNLGKAQDAAQALAAGLRATLPAPASTAPALGDLPPTEGEVVDRFAGWMQSISGDPDAAY